MATLKEKQVIKDLYTEVISQALSKLDEEVLRTKTNTLAVPFVYPNGEEGYVTITIAVPSGDRAGEAYDGYAEAEDFAIKQKEKLEKAKAAAEVKARKIEQDKARRAKKEVEA